MNTQLANMVEGAFDYHPFGWNAPVRLDEYAVGPTFVAWCPGFEPRERIPLYEQKDGESYLLMARSLLRYAPVPNAELTVSKDAHKRGRTKENCKARALMLGEYEMDIELAYPLYKLMRFYKPDRFALDNGILYAWDGERIVFAAKTRPRNCMEDLDEIVVT